MPAFTGKLRLMVLVLWVSCVFIFCEYVIYFPTILRCSWPEMTDHKDFRAPLRALFLSDTHLLGAIRGHWFDKLRREWQMERAFQTALWLLKPEVVFILGDIFDEGKWSSPKDWEDDVRRFKQIFRHPSDMELVVLIGNHDIGFHHDFLLVNSVALHGDHCPICKSVESELHHLSQALNCSVQATHASSSPSSHQQSHNAGGERHRCKDVQKYASSPPVILQHYPLYRASDSKCTGVDAAPPNERYKQFHERYDVLSQDASKMLLWWFQPRLILSGHTHSGCEFLHENRFPEVSVPSFSWRNRNNPSFILGSFSQSDFALSKCFLPEESSVIAVYCGSVLVIALITLSHLSVFRRALRLANRLLGKQKSI